MGVGFGKMVERGFAYGLLRFYRVVCLTTWSQVGSVPRCTEEL